MSALIRDAPLGQLIRLLFGSKNLPYPEEEPNFQLPSYIARAIEGATGQMTPDTYYDEEKSSGQRSAARSSTDDSTSKEQALEQQPETDATHNDIATRLDDGTVLVDWYGPNDPDNPQNWSFGKKCIATAIILLYTVAIYAGSAIITPSYAGMQSRFGVSLQVVSLTLSMFVLAYGLGPMLWSPLSEVPSIGRNAPYIITFALFVILTVPAALAENFAGLVVVRFLLGFFGSPALATGAASLSDMYTFNKLPYALSLWAYAACCGPALAPLISGFSVPATSWRWSSWEMLWLAGPVWIFMFLLLPETFHATILRRRAARLRAATGITFLKSQSEVTDSQLELRAVVIEALWRPIQVTVLDPSIAFTAVYSALVYGIYYSFFEAFPLVYGEMYGFNSGQLGLTYLSITVGVSIAIVLYWIYIHHIVEPAILKGDIGSPERRLIPALAASFLAPIGLLIFAWTSRPDIHWIVPTIGVMIYNVGIFIILQCIFLYLGMSFPQYTASVFAGNDVARSTLAAGTIHFSHPLFVNLGVDRGVTLLAGLTIGCIFGVFALWKYGAWLRSRSKFTPK